MSTKTISTLPDPLLAPAEQNSVQADPPKTEHKEHAITTHSLILSNKPRSTTASFPVHAPRTGNFLYNFSSASISDADVAITSAQNACQTWRNTLPSGKRDIFLKAAAIMESRQAELVKIICDETGGTASWADFNIFLAIDFVRDVAGRISSITGFVPTTGQEGIGALILKEPYGVTLAIAPWNAPYVLGCRSFIYPLAAGNTVILKMSELSPLCIQSMAQCFVDAGLPAGALNTIAHQPSDAALVTKHLISNPSIKKINFTGSTVVGRIIAELAGRYLKPVLLELGGKASAIVCEDANLELAARECALGAFINAGQVCMSTERIFVHEKVTAEFEEALKNAIKTTQAGYAPEDPDTLVLVSKAGAEKAQKLVADAVCQGAKILVGNLESTQGARMTPIVVKGLTKQMDLFYTESFGPVVSLRTFSSEEEALDLANDTEYGLSSAVFTTDLGRGLRIAGQIESGAVHINSMTVHDEPALPHGGMKASGFGRFGALSLDEWVRTKTVTYRH